MLNNSLFKCVQGNEYFSGPFPQILEVFNFISNLNDDKILYYINNKHISLNINEEKHEKENINNIENEKQHIIKQKYYCDICNREFTSSRGLKVHIISHNKEEKPKILDCNFCNKTFSNTKILKIHFTRCKEKKESEIKHVKEILDTTEKENKENQNFKYRNKELEKENFKLKQENFELKQEIEKIILELEYTKRLLLLKEDENKEFTNKIINLYFSQNKYDENSSDIEDDF